MIKSLKKKQDFSLSLEDTFFNKPQGSQIVSRNRFRVKSRSRYIFLCLYNPGTLPRVTCCLSPKVYEDCLLVEACVVIL